MITLFLLQGGNFEAQIVGNREVWERLCVGELSLRNDPLPLKMVEFILLRAYLRKCCKVC